MLLEPAFLSLITGQVSGTDINTPEITVVSVAIILFVLLMGSMFISAAESAYFSLRPNDLERLRSSQSKNARRAAKLSDNPEKLLSTIILTNLIINIFIVLLAASLLPVLFDFTSGPFAAYLIEGAAIIIIMLLFGEIIPKFLVSGNQLRLALFMSIPLTIIEKLFRPFTSLLVHPPAFIKRRGSARRSGINIDNLSDALELTPENINEDEKILKGIVNFGNISVSAIMCPRIDVTAVDIKLGFNKVKAIIIESGFSRIPVFSGSFDTVKGILYAKDILPYINNPDTFRWQSLMRPSHFVPETKKINDLLKEFQLKKLHMAVVIDEYGGTTGIITLEDILEEIVGEISDESDVEENLFRRIDDRKFIFEGKVLLNDFFKIIEADAEPFEKVRGESETLAGLVLELTGEIPQKGQVIKFNNFMFRIESADKRRIKEIIVEIAEEDGKTTE